MVTTLTVVDVGKINHRPFAASLSVAVDDIMIVVPRVFVEVFPVLVVKGQQCLDIIAGIFLGEGFCSLLETIVTPAQQTIGNSRVDNLSCSPALRSSLFEMDIHATRRWDAVVGQGNGLIDSNGLKSDGLTVLAAGTEQQDEGTGIE